MAFFTRRLKPYFLILGALLGLNLILALAGLFLIQQAHSLQQRVKISREEIISVTHKGADLKNLPEIEKTHFIAQTKAAFIEAFFAGPEAKLPDYRQNALAFKERLFEVQEKLRKEAAANNFTLPEDLGFGQYQVKVPEEKEVLVLNKKLDIVSEVLKLMMASGLYRLDSIGFAESRQVSAKLNNISAQELPLKLRFSGAEKGWLEFLYQLRRAKNIYLLESMMADRTSNSGAVQVGLTVAGVVFDAGNVKKN